MTLFSELEIKLFADGADIREIVELAANPLICGFTTNPTLMRKAGVKDYESFARAAVETVPDRPICFEVFADDFEEMEEQALHISAWGENVYVKIPVTNCRSESSASLLRRLVRQDVRLNVTALMTVAQVEAVAEAIEDGPSCFISIFAGRIADTGRDPVPLIAEAVDVLLARPQLELIWASPRELLNIFHAAQAGCHIITVTPELLKKLPVIGKDLGELSLETVQMFHEDAAAAGYRLRLRSLTTQD